ncbi:L-ascorbate metabolism protein UlaG, beta-lactamase superfamily [Microbacterium sp. cf046]|uniref:MBL fold metallo-hydrolase n=1 Tax=Microbacterium sp. cf046 TaxID=1761803 RepID=UPI0008F16CE3|nr:MBL fold metallo-hydrolase [Microbacterium sp. cf046]SFR90761.1 L-ascorbate metabolism protein UlaG, beta-lactamase superfamily [Microbacterium sp. cf046]
MRITRIGGPTVLIEWDGWRILTDPTFDPPGRTYAFALGTSSRKVTGPAVELDELGAIDLALVSHHHHADNLDDAGREALGRATTVLTTEVGAQQLRHPDVRGLAPGQSITLQAEGRPPLTVAATPCRHGPPLTTPIVGHVVGFALTLESTPHPGLWVTGDTVMYGGLRAAAANMRPDVMIVHIGRVKFPRTGPLTYTMDAADAVELVELTEPGVVVPVHVEGWSHFSEQEEAAGAVFSTASPDVQGRIRWLPLGEATELPG